VHAEYTQNNEPNPEVREESLVILPPPTMSHSLQEIFETEESALLRYAFGITRDRGLAEEVVQEAFLKLHSLWDQISSPRPWLYSCIRNLALNNTRKRSKEVDMESQPEPEHSAELPDQFLGRLEACGHLRLLISKLPEEDQQLLNLKYQERLSYADIAKSTGLTISNVGYKLHHLLKTLGTWLREAGIESYLG